MSKSANKTLIGAFVVGATALLLLAIAVFGSGKLFQTTSRYVLFFRRFHQRAFRRLSGSCSAASRWGASLKSGSRATLII